SKPQRHAKAQEASQHHRPITHAAIVDTNSRRCASSHIVACEGISASAKDRRCQEGCSVLANEEEVAFKGKARRAVEGRYGEWHPRRVSEYTRSSSQINTYQLIDQNSTA